MIKQRTRWQIYFSLLWLGLLTSAQVQAAAILNEISHSVLPGNRIAISLDFDQNAPMPASFTTDNPARIVLDFPNIELDVAERSQTIGIGAVQSVRSVEANQRTRVVINLVNKTKFNMQRDAERLLIEVGVEGNFETPQVASAPMPATSPAPVPQPIATPVSIPESVMPSEQVSPVSIPMPVPSAQPVALQPPVSIPLEPSLMDVNFRRGADGAGQLIVKLSERHISVDMKEEGKNKILLTFKDSVLPEHLDRRLDVTDFATPILSIDTSVKGNDVRMLVATQGRYTHLAYQTDNIYTLEVKQFVEKPEEVIDISKRTYTGERLSLSFQDIDIRAVLKVIADFKGVNIIVTDEVSGNITLNLQDVPWDQALDIILESKDLGIRKLGRVWSIDLQKNIDEQERRALEARKEIKKLEPLRTEFITINYSKASDLEKLLKDGGNKASSHSFVSNRGSVSVDERTNTLVIQDTSERLEDIRRLIRALDKPVRQVLIESRVVIANDDFTKDLGVKFGQSTNFTFGKDNEYGLVTSGKNEGDITFGAGGTGVTVENKEGLIIDLPAAATAGTPAALGLIVGKIGTYLLQLELSALQSEGRGEIISSPRVITANQHEAVIKQGVEVSLFTAGGVGVAGTVTFKEVVLMLKVKPQITPDDRIIMDLHISKDNIRLAGGFDKREVKSRVLVDNGETVILGGVYEQNSQNLVKKVPFVSDLPLVGTLFRQRQHSDAKQELLIFITPKILQEKSL